jgi:ATP-binding cassette, subfamily B, bacterial
VNGLVAIAQNTISLFGIAGLLFAFSGWVVLILFLAAIPVALVRLIFARKRYRLEQAQTSAERHAWYYNWILTDSVHAKEVRLFDLGSLFCERFRSVRRELRERRLTLSRSRIATDLVVQGLMSIAIFGSFGFMAYRTIGGALTIGALVMYYQSFQSGLGSVRAIFGGLAGLYEDNLFLSNFYRFLDLKPAITAPPHPQPVPTRKRQGVCFHNVSFTYPGSLRSALNEISITIAPGEVIALVGENGSGKTTLVKLLCRLYDPSAGEVTVDGIDLRELDPICWRHEISVILQDYIHYHLSARENIWLSNLDLAPDSERIVEAARLSGADPVIRGLPESYDTLLGHWFEGGHELSVGEWQKVALARAFVRDSGIIVLDEPTSSLDPLAEAEVFGHLREFIQDRSAVLISHRFSTVQMADRIYVLKNGMITEQGTHRELLQQGGQYARLYRIQADRYLDGSDQSARQPTPQMGGIA